MDEETLMWLQMLMQGMMPQIAGPGAGKDITTSEQAKQRNLFQDNMQIMSDPFVGVLASSMGIPGAFDYGQLTEQAPMEPLPSTPTLSAYEQSQDPLEKTIWEMVNAGQSRTSINSAIRAAGIDEAVAGDYMKDAETMLGERTSFSDAQAKQASAPKDLSPVEKAYRDAGIPFGAYDEQTLTPGRAQTVQNAEAATGEFQSAQKALNQALKLRTATDDAISVAPGPDYVAPQAGMRPESEYDQQSPMVQAWWNAQKGANSVMDGVKGAVTDTSLGDAIAGLFRKQDKDVGSVSGDPWGSVTPMPKNLLQQNRGGMDDNVAKLQADRDEAKKASTNAHRERVKSNGYLHGSQQATRGRTPQSDALMARQLVQRLMGMS